MRILLWYWGRRGGGAQYALRLAEGLAGAAPGELILSVSRQNELLDAFRALPAPQQEIDTYNGKLGFLVGFARLPGLGRALRRFGEAHETRLLLSAMAHPWTPFLAPGLARAGFTFIPVIHDATPHPGDDAPLFAWRLRRELAAARAAVVLSSSVADSIATLRPDLPLIRLSLGAHLPPSPVLGGSITSDFLFFGRIRRYKGLDLLRDAWTRLHAAHPHTTLRIVGEGDLAACAPGLAMLPGVTVEQRWVKDAEMASVLAASRALVLPYREASQSGVLPLALALGLPVVATAVGGLAGQFRDGETGLLAEPDPDALAAAMGRMLDPTLRAGLADAARQAGAALTDWTAQAQALREGIARAIPSAT